MDKYEVLETPKFPTTSNKYLGIEIEFFAEIDEEELMDELVAEGLEYNCMLDDDGSIRPNETYHSNDCSYYVNSYTCNCNSMKEYRSYELKVLTLEAELVSTMTRVARILRKVGAEVNSSCGLHVHIDLRKRNVPIAIGNLLRAQKDMFKMVPINRRKNQYCAASKLTPTQVKARYDKKKDVIVNAGERAAVNAQAYNEHRTVEVRLHEGTVNGKAIIDWCQYLLHLVDKKKPTKKVRAYAKKRMVENNTRAG